MKTTKPIEIDGSTGEGGGQLVRIAVALSAVSMKPIRIINIRANRPKGGLKSQHTTAIRWLADATNAKVEGLEIGSRALTFSPQQSPASLQRRRFSIATESSAASALLVLQAILPFLIFAGTAAESVDNSGDVNSSPIEVEISGGTNVSFSLSYEYLDQILLPALQERFGIMVERKLVTRGWSLGPQSRGTIWVRIHPLTHDHALKSMASTHADAYASDNKNANTHEIAEVDVSIVAPTALHEALQEAVSRDASAIFPGAEIHFLITQDSRHDSRIYLFLVAKTAGNTRRWGRDVLASTPKPKGKKTVPDARSIAEKVSREAFRELRDDVAVGGDVDEYLQDQLVCFQALAEGLSVVSRDDNDGGDTELDEALRSLDIGDSVRKDRCDKPFGNGSLHARTARWVVCEILPQVSFFKGGSICQGAGITCGQLKS